MKAITQGVEPEKPCVDHKQNLETLRRAFENDSVALMEVRLVSTGERCAAICAVSKDGDEFTFTPFAIMLNGNPFELLDPPHPDGGFVSQEEANRGRRKGKRLLI